MNYNVWWNGSFKWALQRECHRSYMQANPEYAAWLIGIIKYLRRFG